MSAAQDRPSGRDGLTVPVATGAAGRTWFLPIRRVLVGRAQTVLSLLSLARTPTLSLLLIPFRIAAVALLAGLVVAAMVIVFLAVVLRVALDLSLGRRGRRP
jgi:hypothetical protein